MNEPTSPPASTITPLEGLPHLVCSTEQLLPVILGFRTFRSQTCVLCETGSPFDRRTRNVLTGLGIHILNPEGSFVLSAGDATENETVLRQLREWIRGQALCSNGLLWNYAAGTKPVAIAIDRYLGPETPESPIREMFYIDTRKAEALFIDGHRPEVMDVRLDVPAIIQANGWKVIAGICIRQPIEPPHKVHQPREVFQWIEQAARGDQVEVYGRLRDVSMGVNDTFSLAVAGQLIRHGVVDEVWNGLKVLPATGREADGSHQDIDLALSTNNTLWVIECKVTKGNVAEAVLKVKQIAKTVGGNMCRPIYLRAKPSKGILDVRQTGLYRKAEEHQVHAMYWDMSRPQAEAKRFAKMIFAR